MALPANVGSGGRSGTGAGDTPGVGVGMRPSSSGAMASSETVMGIHTALSSAGSPNGSRPTIARRSTLRSGRLAAFCARSYAGVSSSNSGSSKHSTGAQPRCGSHRSRIAWSDSRISTIRSWTAACHRDASSYLRVSPLLSPDAAVPPSWESGTPHRASSASRFW